MLAVILTVGLGFVVACGASPKEHVYTVPEVQSSFRALQGRTVLVRGIMGYPESSGWSPFLRPCPTCGPKIYAIHGDVVHHGRRRSLAPVTSSPLGGYGSIDLKRIVICA
jgi:hypothetical protein